jgi:PAS domain S-box-containing protein
VVAIFVDITGRKRVEEQLLLKNIVFESSVAANSIADIRGIITHVNPAFLKLWGYRTTEEAIGHSVSSFFVREEDGLSVLEALDTLGRWEGEFLAQKTDGSTFVTQGIATVIRDGNGELIGYQSTNLDITDRNLTEVQREKLIAELEQKNAELERFTYTVSHDLKSPLITIKGFASLLEDDALGGDPLQLKKDIRRITEAAGTMQELLADVLELARAGKIVSPPQKTPFLKIACEAMDLLAGPLAERHVTVDIVPDLPLVYADHARIREVMTNLIGNAVKFFGDQENPVIRIGVDRSGDIPVFFVQDNGIGIDPRYLERIFNLFERLDVSTPGTGIGLTIVRRIIEVHGGKIWAESAGPGKGTTFRFTLPGVPADRDTGVP